MADSPNTRTLSKSHSRRDILALAGSLAAATAAAGVVAIQSAHGAEHPDAALLKLKVDFDKQLAVVLATKTEIEALEQTFEDEVVRQRIPTRWRTFDDPWWVLRRECGLEALCVRYSDEHEAMDTITKAIRETPAVGFAGLAVKAWATAFDIHFIYEFDTPLEDMDWQEQTYLLFLREIERMAAIEAVS